MLTLCALPILIIVLLSPYNVKSPRPEMVVENKSKLVKWLEAQPQVEITKRLIDEHRVVHNVG